MPRVICHSRLCGTDGHSQITVQDTVGVAVGDATGHLPQQALWDRRTHSSDHGAGHGGSGSRRCHGSSATAGSVGQTDTFSQITVQDTVGVAVGDATGHLPQQALWDRRTQSDHGAGHGGSGSRRCHGSSATAGSVGQTDTFCQITVQDTVGVAVGDATGHLPQQALWDRRTHSVRSRCRTR